MPSQGHPLSFAQQRLWFVDRLSPGIAFYNVPQVLELDGPLDVGSLTRAVGEIVRRHEPLRTVFPSADGRPHQEVLPYQPFSIPIEDLSSAHDQEAQARLEQHVQDEIRRPFNLATGPIIRSSLVRMGPDRHVLIIVIHHISFDGWSIGLFFRELAALYDAFSTGRPSPLHELPTRYVDFAVRQRELMTGETFERQMAFWREQLKPPRPVLALPSDRPRPAVQTHRGWQQLTVIPEAMFSALQDLSRREGVTVFMTLLAAYATFLQRLTGQDDVLIGTPIANRTTRDVEALIGFFANSLTIRLDVSGDPPFRSLLQHARRVAIGAYTNQDLPFERIVEALNPERTLSHTPIVQTFLVLDNNPNSIGEIMSTAGLMMRRKLVTTGTSKFDLTTSVRRAEAGRRVVVDASADLFDAETAGRMLRMFVRLIEGVIDNPDTPIARLPIVADQDRRQVTVDWNPQASPDDRRNIVELIDAQVARTPDSEAVELLERRDHQAVTGGMSEATRAQLLSWAGHDAFYPRDRTVSELVEAHAIESPDAVAVVGQGCRLTYAQLNARANQLAHYLRSRIEAGRSSPVGGEGARIAVSLERSVDTIVALLAILKAGAAYVPLDPAYPPSRIAALVARGRPQFVLTQRIFSAQLADVDARLLLLDSDADVIAAEPTSNPGRFAGPGSLAYVLFTSGTTGDPKAVGVPHRAIVRLVYGLPDVALGAGTTAIQLAPLSFDAATFEIWGPLLRGGCVAITPEDLIASAALESFIAAHHVTVMWLTASLFNAVIDDRPQALAGLRYLLIGGEALSVPHVQRALAALPRTRIINGYGPTETTTFACTHVIRADDLSGAASIPIGRPLSNTRVYVLGPDRRLVSPGEAGELWIGGDGVAIGYLNDEELTAARFAPDPFAGKSGARMYGSGDRVRFLADGALEFLGRFDDQIKVRGFRIEPGEVEAALAQHPRVSRAVVGAFDLPVVGRSLVAVVVPAPVTAFDPSDRPLASELRDFLRQHLPDYMVPSQWATLAAFPLLPSGKIDRRSVAELACASITHVGRPVREASSPTEEAIADIWRTVLNIGHVGRDENFFDLGGHSLLATQLLSRIQATFGIDMDLRAVFTNPTVEGLAREVERLSSSDAIVHRAIPPTSRTGSLPPSFAQQRLWFLHQWHGDSSVYNVPTAFRLTGHLDVKALTRAITASIDRHEALRTVFPLEDGAPVQRVLAHLAIEVPITDFSDWPPDQAEAGMLEVVARESTRTFDLAGGPLIRSAIVRLSSRQHILVITLHHIVSDGWSLGVLFKELQHVYEAERTGQPIRLPPLFAQYADFAVWQRRQLRGSALAGLLQYWRRKLRPLPPRLDMPLDHPRPDETTTRGGRVRFQLPATVASALARLAADEHTTLFVTSLAVYLAVLSRYSGQEDICVGTPVANRTRPEIEALIGCFVNTLAIRGDVSGDPTFHQLVRRTRETAIDAQVHQDLPFELLVDALEIERSANHTPIFQAMFGLLEGVATTLELADLVVARVPVPFDFAKFDLTLDLRPTADGLSGVLEYKADLFDRQTAEGFAEDYTTLLTTWIEHPDRRLSEIALPAADQKRRTGARVSARDDEAREVPLVARRSEPTAVERRLASIWQRVLAVDKVGTNDNFFELGGTSLIAVRLFTEVEEAFGVRLPLSTLFRNGTIDAQARLLSQTAAPDVWSAIVPIQPLGTRDPLFLVHGIGGEVLSFHALATRLGTEQPLYGLQADSRDNGCRTSSIESVAARYVEAMRHVQPDGPYRLGGYSSGGVIAYEMAQRLRADGQDVALLVMLDAFAPKAKPEELTPSTIWRLVKNVAYWPFDDDFLRSEWAAQRRRVSGKVKSMRSRRKSGGLVEALDAGADVRDLLGLWKVPAHARGFLERYVRMMAAYHPEPYPGEVTVIRARTFRLAFRGTPDLGWRRLATGGVTITIVPGAHDTILKEPRVRQLAAALSKSLQRTQG